MSIRVDHWRRSGARAGRLARWVLYWLAVVAVSIVLVIVLLLLLQSFDASTVGAVATGGD